MNPNDRQVQHLLRTRVIRLNEWITGITTGVVAGLVLFLATNYLILKGGPVVGPHLALLGQVFIGYRVTFAGSLIGAVWAFVSGAVVGFCAAKVYNLFAGMRRGRNFAERK
jgi:hypothetical protein